MQKLLPLSKNILGFLITAILITVPLYPKFPLFRIPGTYVSVRLEDFLIAVTLLTFIPLALSNYQKLIKTAIIRAIIVFLIIGLISLLSGIFLTQTVSPFIGILHWLRRIEYMSMFIVGYIFIKNTDKNFINYLLKLLLIINFVVFLYGVGQRYFNFPVIVTQNEEYSKGIALRWIPGAHINSTFAGHYDLASYLVMTLPLFIASFFSVKNRNSKAILLISILCGFWLLTSAVSRISIVAGKKGWMFDEVYKTVEDLGLNGKVIFTDYFPEEERPILMSGCRFYAQPSFWEGFGIEVLNAFASGKPVLVSNLGSLPEIAGEAGVYVNPYDVDNIAEGMARILSLNKKDYNILVQKGFEQLKNFSWEKCAKLTLEVLEHV